MKQKIKILHLEDLPSDAELIARELKKGKIDSEILVVGNRAKFVRALKKFSPVPDFPGKRISNYNFGDI